MHGIEETPAAMDDVWFGPDASRSYCLHCLAALSVEMTRGEAFVVLSKAEGQSGRLGVASGRMMALLGTTTIDALETALLRSDDPGARRLALLVATLPIGAAARMERLRFSGGPIGAVVTMICRKIKDPAGRPVLVAAAIGLPPARTLMPSRGAEEGVPLKEDAAFDAQSITGAPHPIELADAASAEAHTVVVPNRKAGSEVAHSDVRARWPTQRSLRFLWTSNAAGVLTSVSPGLSEIVGHENGDVAGRRLDDLALLLDPSGQLGVSVASRASWSGRDVIWPIDDIAAGVHVALGATPIFDGAREFQGYRGYGLVRLDAIEAQAERRLTAPPTRTETGNVVAFRSRSERGLSPADELAFAELGAELRDQAGLSAAEGVDAGSSAPPIGGADLTPASEAGERPAAVGSPNEAAIENASLTEPLSEDAYESASLSSTVVARAEAATHRAIRAEEIARNGFAVAERLPIGVLVSRDNVPIFANRFLLDLLGFADEDALHDAGGMTHLFGGQPGNNTGSETIGIRAREGRIVPAIARMQRVDWDGLPATLLTLQRPSEPNNGDLDARIEDLRRQADDLDRRETELERRHALATARSAEAGTLVATAVDSELGDLRAILETATDGVAVIDGACRVLTLNRSGEALFGCDRSAVIGRPLADLFAPHDQKLVTDYIEGLKSDATRSLLNDGREFLIRTAQDDTIAVFMTVGRLGSKGEHESGEPARFCALFRDLTHWKKVESELEAARRAAEHASATKTDFLSKVSQQIRTPLNAMIGFTEIIMEERFGPIGNVRYKDYLNDIHSRGKHVLTLVGDLLDLSTIEAGRMELDIKPLDANKIVADCVATMQPQASRERVIMRLSLAPTLPPAQADERSLRQIVLAILSNAVKYNEPGGQVIISTATLDTGSVTIRIRDTGPGMSEEEIALAMEPFRQGAAPQETTGGTGLGLPLMRALIAANNGSFAIRSKVDQGTLVEVTFPPARMHVD